MKKEESIKNRIVKRFIASTLIVTLLVALSAFISFNLYSDYTFEKNAQSAASFIQNGVLDGVDIASLSPDANKEQYEEISEDFDDFCISFDLYYLYIYTLNDDGMVVRNVIATESESAAEKVKDNHLIGKKREPNDYEKEIISGKTTQISWKENNEYGRVRSYRFGIYNENGNLAGFLGIDYLESEITNFIIIGTLIIVILLAIVLLLVFVLEYKSLNTNVFKPISTISSMMSNFIEDRKEANNMPELPTSAEIQSIVTSFDKMSVDIQNYLNSIEKLTEERAKDEAVMETARKIQMGFVPSAYEHKGANAGVYAIECPAKAVGGDFYDCFIKGNMLYGVVGDVSEKGISSAMFMIVLKSKISDYLKAGISPAEALLAVNDEISEQNPEGMFATVFAFKLNLKNGEMIFANAGHNKPVVICDNVNYLEMNSGMLLGLMKGIHIENETLILKPYDSLLIYTDGVTEAINKNRELYGEERLLSLLSNAQSDTSTELTSRVKQSVDEYQAGCEQFDDITVFSVKYYGETELTLPCRLEAFDEIHQTIFSRLGKTENSKKILLVCEEIFVNICEYSQAEYIKALFTEENGYFSVTMKDNGSPFNPLEYEMVKPFEQLSNGGMGISMAKQIAEKLEYCHENGENILKILFNV